MHRPFINYPGNKNSQGLAQWIINTIPPHEVFIELFLGSGAILSMKEPALLNIGNDINSEISCSWKKLQGPGNRFFNLAARVVASIYERSNKKILFYADPPYTFISRKSKRNIYKHEMTNQGHVDLLNCAAVSKHNWIISGYDCDLYTMMLPGWNKKTKEVSVHGKKAVECIWYNFPDPVDIHDYKYLGKDRTDRQRIKRKVARWTENFKSLPPLEQKLILKNLLPAV
jgi:DNA adenine methylase